MNSNRAKQKAWFRILTITRSTNNQYGSDVVYFTRNDRWDYKWIKRHFGITLKPGEKKDVCIEEMRP